MAQAVLISHPYTNSVATIEIASAKVVETLSNLLIAIPMYVRKAIQDTTSPSTKIVKTNRMTHQIVVTGYLISDTTSTALQKKEALISYDTLSVGHPEAPSSIGLLFKSGDLKMTWRAEEIQCSFDKITFSDVATTDQREGNPDKYSIILTLRKGVVR